MKVLVTNDDGINSINLKILTEALTKYFDEIMIVAPTFEQSAVSHKINIATPITLIKYPDLIKGVKTYSIDSTPADCVKFAVECLNYDFDILFSGFNNGLNLGEDIVYSGTVAATTEALFYKKRAIALSVERNETQGFYDSFPIFIKQYLNDEIYNQCLCYNVNLPAKPRGIKFAYQGSNKYDYWFEKLEDGTYLSKAKKQFKENQDIYLTDLDCYHNGYITVTPISVDMTNYEVLKVLNNK